MEGNEQSVVHTFRIEGMHCGSCAMLVDDALEDLPGVRSTRTSVKQGRSVVELDPACSPGDVIAVVVELGYSAHHMS